MKSNNTELAKDVANLADTLKAMKLSANSKGAKSY